MKKFVFFIFIVCVCIPSLTANAEGTQTEEKLNITGDPEYECTKSGGKSYDKTYKTCICDDENDHLTEDTRTYNNIEYSICRCVDGYKRKNTKTDEQGNIEYLATGECVPANDYEIQQVPNTEKYRQDAEDAYRNEYDNAQSWANKGVTGLSTLMTGEGAKMAAQAWAEQIADRDAETEMRDYIAGMRCEYGNGNTVKLGDETDLPGGNELGKNKTEFKTLLSNLRRTKTALGLRPGIESEILYNPDEEAEVLYDRAETGLYQYRVAEIATGDNVSLARALMNPDGDDATKWNEQKAETSKNLTTGTLLTAGGLAVGIGGNYLANRNHEKEYKNLKMTFTEIKKELQIKYPEAFVPEEIPVTPVTEEPIIATIEETPPVIEQPQQATQLDLEPFSDKYLFASGSYKLKNNVSALDDYIQRVIDTLNRPEYADFKICIQIDGHTDRVPPKPGFMSNQVLSQKRADSVKDYLDTELGSIKTHISNITSTGHGEEQCTKDKYKKIDDSNCRRIDITTNACDN